MKTLEVGAIIFANINKEGIVYMPSLINGNDIAIGIVLPEEWSHLNMPYHDLENVQLAVFKVYPSHIQFTKND